MGSSSDFNLNLEPSAEQSSPELSADEQSKNRLEEGDLMEVISRMYSDHKKMTKMVVEIVHNFSSLHSQLMQYLSTNTPENNPQIRKRKLADSVEEDDDDDGYTKMMSCSCINDGRLKMLNLKPKVSKALIRVDPSDSSLVVKDGYQWRKYGQKVTRDNPSPRAYFKCSFAPLCPVKKKVQKSAEDPTILVVLYEGEHTHKKPSTHEITPSCTIPSSSLINLSSSSHDISSSEHRIRHKDKPFEEENVDQHWLVERMASSLTKDPSFTSTLATLISDKVLEQTFY